MTELEAQFADQMLTNPECDDSSSDGKIPKTHSSTGCSSQTSEFCLEPLVPYARFQSLYVIALHGRLCVTHCFGNITK